MVTLSHLTRRLLQVKGRRTKLGSLSMSEANNYMTRETLRETLAWECTRASRASTFRAREEQ